MATIFDLTDGTDTVNFLTGPLELRTNGWSVLSSNDEFVWEIIELISDTADSTARSEMAKLGRLIHRARNIVKDELSSKTVWLEWVSEGEPVKRSRVVDGSIEILADGIYSPLMGVDSIKVTLALKRKNSWENTAYTTASTEGLSVTGGKWLIGNDAGNLPQRIRRLNISTNTVLKTKYWVGIRPIYQGTTDFDPLWECEDGTNYTDASDVGDGGASGGNLVRVSFSGTPTLAKRFKTSVNDVLGGGNANHFIGKYQVLCRCRVDAGNTQARIQLRSGFFYSAHELETVIQDTVIDGQTTWNLVELGEVQFPSMGNRDGLASGQLFTTTLAIFAERLSAGGTIDFDAFILIPSEYFFSCESLDEGVGSGPTVYKNSLGDQFVVGRTSTVWSNIDYSITNWEYPLGGGLLVCAAEGSSHTLTGTLDIDVHLYPQWQTYRV